MHASALKLRERALGRRHGDLASTLNNVAVLLMDLRRNDEALPLLQRAVRISKAAAGKSHPQHATALANLGKAFMQLDRPSDARPHLQHALDINRKAFGESHESTQSTAESVKTCETAISGRLEPPGHTRTDTTRQGHKLQHDGPPRVAA